MSAKTLSRAGVAAAALSGFALLAAAPAQATTGELAYECLYGTIKVPITAQFDSAIEDGADVPAGDVSVNPVSGKVTIAEAQVNLIKFLGAKTLAGKGTLDSGVAETEQAVPVDFAFPATDVPASGAMSIDVTGEAADPIDASEPGEYGFYAGDVELTLTTDKGTNLALKCTLDAETSDDDALIDWFTAVEDDKPTEPTETPEPTGTPEPTPSTTAPSPSTSPERPEVVQTDAAQPTSPAWLPMTAMGAGAVLLGGGFVATRRSASRR